MTVSENCSETEFLNTILMRCEPCLTQNSDNYDNFDLIDQTKRQIKSIDGFECVCRSGFRQDFKNSSNGRLYCINNTNDCPFDSKPLNGFQCAYCSPNNTISTNDSLGNGLCLCPKHHFLVESMNENKIEIKCEKCPKHLSVSSDGKSCKPCHQSFIKASGDCFCPIKSHIEEDGICLPEKNLIKKDNLNTLSMIEFENTNKRFISYYFYRHSRPAVYNCKYESNITACQLLANLCVLYYYSYSEDMSTDSNVCKILLKSIQKSPEIYYKGYYKNELQQLNVPNKFKTLQKLQFVASRFSIDGKLIEYSDLRDNEIQLCYENDKSSKSAFIFGTNFRQTCVRSARDLWDNYKSKNIFFELCLKHINNNEITLYGVPLIIKNLKKDNRFVNIDYLDSSEEQRSVQLTRRFFLIDSIAGIEKTSDDSTVDYSKTRAKVLRYAKSIHIDIKLRKQDGSGSIYPPSVTIFYENLLLSDYEKNTEVEIEFSVTYSMDDLKTKQDLSITLSVLSCAAVLWSVFRTWCWSKRSGKIAIDLFTIEELFIRTCGAIANVFFFVHIFTAIYQFLVFKNQSVIHTLLLTSDQESLLIVYIIIAFFLKLLHLIQELLVIGTIDIFFIDWERPKKRDQNSSVTITRPKSGLTVNDNNENVDIDTTERPNKPNSGSRSSISGSLISPSAKSAQLKPFIEFPNVTVWRSNFVANEWMELCGRRRLSLSFHVLLVILTLDWFGFANLAASDPRNTFVLDDYQRYVPQSRTCRIAVGALVYCSLAIINIILKKFVYESIISNKLNEFVDLCSVCNVSVFCMKYKQYGYYIHGLAANGKSDVNMLEMYELLEREENDLCSKRGLLPNTDQQTFEMAIPASVNEHYQRLRSNLTGFSQTSDRMHAFGGHLSKADKEKLIPTYLLINKFLTGFIEHTFKDVDYIVRDKSTLESIFDVESIEVRDKGFFYNDNGHSFEGVLFYSLELTLITFEIMLFIIIDLCVHSFTFAAILTFIVSKAIRKLYLNIARKNLVRKSLIDERFLI